MEHLSIKVKIADREYPLKVKLQEEERIRTAAKMLNEKVKKFREQFGKDDKIDLLAMTAFDLMVEKLRREESIALSNEHIDTRLDYLEDLINTTLNE
jgi:cell division protein ZapA